MTSAHHVPTITLNNGQEMPVIGLGTYLAKDGEVEQAVKDAIDAGYRHIDTAFFYGNEVQLGNAVRAKIKEGVVKREDMFIVTKLWNSFHAPQYVRTACEKSIENLNLGPIDLYLLHAPMGYKFDGNFDGELLPKDSGGNIVPSDIDFVDTWLEMENLQKEGLCHGIGVSNFNSEQIERLLKEATIKPLTNQVECSPNLNQRKLIKFCQERNIIITAYSPLGRPYIERAGEQPVIFDPNVKEIAEKYTKSPGQIILKYLIQNGAVPIPKSSNKNRINENINIFDFELTLDDMNILHKLNTNHRMVPFKLCATHKHFPFNIEF